MFCLDDLQRVIYNTIPKWVSQFTIALDTRTVRPTMTLYVHDYVEGSPSSRTDGRLAL